MEFVFQRKVDELGRVVLPLELRKTLGFNERDTLRITVEGRRLILEKVSDES